MRIWFEIWNEMELILRVGIKVKFGFGILNGIGFKIWNPRRYLDLKSEIQDRVGRWSWL